MDPQQRTLGAMRCFGIGIILIVVSLEVEANNRVVFILLRVSQQKRNATIEPIIDYIFCVKCFSHTIEFSEALQLVFLENNKEEI